MLSVCLFSYTGSVTLCVAGGLHGAGLMGGRVAGLLGVSRGRRASLPRCFVDGGLRSWFIFHDQKAPSE